MCVCVFRQPVSDFEDPCESVRSSEVDSGIKIDQMLTQTTSAYTLQSDCQLFNQLEQVGKCEKNKKARPRFELGISSLLVRRFNQLSHRAGAGPM